MILIGLVQYPLSFCEGDASHLIHRLLVHADHVDQQDNEESHEDQDRNDREETDIIYRSQYVFIHECVIKD